MPRFAAAIRDSQNATRYKQDTALRPPPHGPSSQKVQERLVTKQLNQAGLVVQFEGIRYPPVSCPPGGFWGYRNENRQRSR